MKQCDSAANQLAQAAKIATRVKATSRISEIA